MIWANLSLGVLIKFVLIKKMPHNKILSNLGRLVLTGVSDFSLDILTSLYHSANTASPQFDISRTDLTLG